MHPVLHRSIFLEMTQRGTRSIIDDTNSHILNYEDSHRHRNVSIHLMPRALRQKCYCLEDPGSTGGRPGLRYYIYVAVKLFTVNDRPQYPTLRWQRVRSSTTESSYRTLTDVPHQRRPGIEPDLVGTYSRALEVLR